MQADANPERGSKKTQVLWGDAISLKRIDEGPTMARVVEVELGDGVRGFPVEEFRVEFQFSNDFEPLPLGILVEAHPMRTRVPRLEAGRTCLTR